MDITKSVLGSIAHTLQREPKTTKEIPVNLRTIEYLQRGIDAAMLDPQISAAIKEKIAADKSVNFMLGKYGQMTEKGYEHQSGGVDYEHLIAVEALRVGLPILKDNKILHDKITDLGQHLYRAIGGQQSGNIKPFRNTYHFE